MAGDDDVIFSKRGPSPGAGAGVAGGRSTGAGAYLSRFADEKVADVDRNFKEDFERKLPGMTLTQLGDLEAAWSDRKSAGYSSATHSQVMELIRGEIAKKGGGAAGPAAGGVGGGVGR